MYDRVEVDVLVDDVPVIEGVLPAHGLAVLLTLERMEEKARLLVDSGPRFSILSYNSREMGIDLSKLDVFVGTLSLRHHIGGFVEARRNGRIVAEKVFLPPPPLAKPLVQKQLILDGVYVVYSDSYWNERAVMIRHRRGWVIVFGCSVHGLEDTWKDLLGEMKNVYAIIGGLNLSMRDMYNLDFLERVISHGNVEYVLPLHSVSVEAREYILEKYGREMSGIEMTGAGVEIVL